MSQPIQSEAHLTTFEAISMIVGNSIGTGIIAVPYLATKNSMLDDPAPDHCRAVLQ